MSDLGWLIVAISAFVAGHELLSHPLRAPLVARLGERGFLIVYTLVAFATLGIAGQLWKAIPPDRLWQAPTWVHGIAVVAMAFAAILFVGSVTAPNPALMGMPAGGRPRGVQRITRHPMMWSFAIWGVVHIILSADSRTIVLASGIVTLALFGAAMQDGKKKAQNPAYGEHMAATGFIPFGAQFRGRAKWADGVPGLVATLGGLALWGVMIWAHPLVVGVPALPVLG
ncbi:NnrU family protein [Polymorphobacter fuscus]|uniref:MFS transporter n=1 Tax=Sandarakinorhabdus fusca TaxID=1439888 RepID=A0A7C9KHT2_9SPHN|nr:NnrU family protein [Polymorphobacter fuscus]KAB7647483.1 MFS transporter [Polymorphobacter fuscus]MQT16741.1 MFS transporter [Polymorphobacter fuscus]NJC09271.1 putative membrane protein [Polymorphobacter fuscus]